MTTASGISFKRHMAYLAAAILISSAGLYTDIYTQHLTSEQMSLAMTQSLQSLTHR